MVIVCAWCERFLGMRGAEPMVTHGICLSCAASQRSPDAPTLVVARHRAELRPVLENLLGAEPAMRIVIDRRVGDRRSPGKPISDGERRRGPDRRRRPADVLLI